MYKNISIIVVLCCTVIGLQAQQDSVITERGSTSNINIVITGDGEATYNYGKKIGDDPIFIDTTKVETDIKYEFYDEKINSNFQVSTIKAPRIKVSDPLSKIYKRYVAFGINDFSSAPMAQIKYNTLYNRKYSTGFELNHFSQKQGVGAPADARYGESEITLYGKRFYDNKTLYGDFTYNHHLFNFYGINTNQLLQWDAQQLNRNVSNFDIVAGVKSTYKDDAKWGYDVSLNYLQLSMDQMRVVEHRADFKSTIKRYMTWKKYTWFKGVFNSDFDVSYLYAGLPADNHQSAFVKIFPRFNFKLKELDLKVGGKVFYQTDDERDFNVMVHADADFKFVKDVLHFFARLDNNFQRLSYLDYVYENPFIANVEDVVNRSTPLDFSGGVKGAFTKNLSFNVGFNYAYHTQMPLFYNLGNNPFGSFSVLTDEVTQKRGFVEFIHEGKKLNVLTTAQYSVYDVAKNEAYHLPNFYAETRLSYKVQDKFVLGTDLFFYGNQLGLESFDANGKPVTVTLDPIFDFNIDLRYNYSKKLGAFLRTNNILNTKHVRWDQYASYGFNFLLGVDYSF